MSLELLESWRTLLGDLGAVGGVLCNAIEADDVLGAISAMAQLRRTRAALAAVEAPVRLRGGRDELDAMAEVSALTINARVAEGAMQRWLARELPGDARLLASPLGAAVLADAMLPAVWDFEVDLAVLIGPGLQPVAEVLGALGQRRIVILDGDPPPGGAAGATSPTGPAGAGATDDAAAAPTPIHVASLDEATIAARTMFPGPPGRLAVRAALSADPAAVEDVVHRLRDVLSDLRIHRNTVRAFSRTWVEQGAANLPAIARWPSVAAIGDRFAGVPMVIVAPGPSLARNIDQLRELRGRAILTAFSHSLRPVIAAGLVPDFVVSVDPQDVRYHFAGCDLSRSCLVNAATVHPSLFELPAQRFLTLSANSAIDDWIFSGLGEDAVIPSGGSVATTAFSLALTWGCDPIVFVGLDLSFPGGQYYVASSADGGARAEVDDHGVMRVGGWSDGFHAMKAAGGPAAVSERVVELPGWAGGTVPSSFMFSMFHRWFVDCMREVTGVSVFNCTEGGAYIDGMDHRPLADVLARLERSIDVAGELDAAAMTVDGARADRMIEHLTVFARRLRRSRWLARAARTLIERGHTGPRLANLEDALATTLRSLTFVSLLAQREVDRAHDIARRPGVETDFLAASASLLGTLIDVADQLEPVLRNALDRLGARRSRGRAA
ncbi:MAG TPA: 6-hydroxymethylpterin diphosphokinase MptE-like protein [Kofleriaceae bacterium]|nr:6-hydroxymethylpterin diphosphokinase MptE-like protein [Kofleriaceae bacterium]